MSVAPKPAATEKARTRTATFAEAAVSLTERLVVAPCAGRFEMSPAQHYTAEGEYVLEGQEVGAIISTKNRERVPVETRFAGWVMGFLVRDGEPVRASQPILWLRRQ